MNHNKLFALLFLSVFLISLVSALDWDNTMDYVSAPEDTITITNALGFGSDLLKAKLNTNLCDEEGRYCEATKTIILYEEEVLVQDFKTIRLDDNSNKEWDIRWWNIQYFGEINDYETQCIDLTPVYVESNLTNNTTGYYYTPQECSEVKVGSHNGWIDYELNTLLPAGTYEVKTSSEIKPGRVYDWQIKLLGEWTTPWAIWGNISEGDEAEVTLNTPTDNSIAYNNPVNFSATANVTGGAYLSNMTPWNNASGTWEAGTSIIFTQDAIAEEAIGISLPSTSSLVVGKSGYKIQVEQATNIVNITKSSGTTATKAYIQTSYSSGIIGTATFSGNTAIFSSGIIIESGIDYWILADNDGSNYVYDYGSTAAIPVDSGIINWNKRIDQAGGEDTSVGNTIIKIGYSNIGNTSSTQTFNQTITDTTIWNVEACDTDGDCGFATSNYTVYLDSEAPSINITAPTGTLDYNYIGGNETLNVTFTDTNLDSCWYDYNGTNISIPGCLTTTLNSTEFLLESDNLNLTVYANDSVGNINSEFVSWDYKVLETNQSYANETRSGNTENFTLTVTLGTGMDISTATLIYNGTTLYPSILSEADDRFILISDYEIPSSDENVNRTFYWNLTLADGTNIYTETLTQSVEAVLLDDCSVYTYNIFNMSLFDEETKNSIYGDIEVNLMLLNKNTYSVINSINLGFENITTQSICSVINLTEEDYSYSAEVRYESDGYAPELYNVQKAELVNNPEQLNLYDLNASDSTEFKVTYQDDSFNYVEGAVLQLQRKYISENIYEIVEAPLTSKDGTTAVHIDLDSNIYKATVVKNGEVLDIFDNIVFVCESELTGECTQALLGAVNPNNDVSLDTIRDFTYTIPTLNDTDDSITISFSVPSGSPSTTNFLMVQSDQFGTSTMCNKTITSSAGSLTCEFNRTIGDSYIELTIYNDGYPIAKSSYKIEEQNGVDFLGNNYIIVVILLLSIVGLTLTSPEWTILMSIVTLFFAGALWLINGVDFAMGLGLLMWLFIAAVIIIFKLSKQEDR